MISESEYLEMDGGDFERCPYYKCNYYDELCERFASKYEMCIHYRRFNRDLINKFTKDNEKKDINE